MSVFSSTCGALGDEGIGELLHPVKHFLLVLGRGGFSSMYLFVPVPAVALGRRQPRLLVCHGFVPGLVRKWLQELQVRGKVISHGQTVKKL